MLPRREARDLPIAGAVARFGPHTGLKGAKRWDFAPYSTGSGRCRRQRTHKITLMPAIPSVSAQFSVTVRVELDARHEPLGKLTGQIAEAGGALQGVDLVPGAGSEGKRVREFTIDARDQAHWEEILRAIGSTRGARVLDYVDRTLQMHRGGKIEQQNKYPLKTRDDLSMAYTPGVARVCQQIAADRSKAFEYTIKRNTVAVVSDGSAVLGLGDIGPEAAMPVMEGKAMLFKEFANVDAFPICLSTHDPDQIVNTVRLMSPTFGGINLEDISAPRCFEIEERLKEELDIPVFHDDQHGTAVVVMAALFNALKIVGKSLEDLRVLVVGLGAAGVAVTKMMHASGVSQVIGCDRQGALSTEREDYAAGEMSEIKRWYAENSNPDKLQGSPADVIEGCDLFIGVSGPGIIPAEALGKMSDDAIVFAMANPNPEVMPEDAQPYVRIMATGRSDYPNQINNVLCFPGIFRGALDAGAPRITEEMKLAAANGIARGGPRGGPERELHHSQRLRPRRGARGGRGGGRGGAPRGDRPGLRGDRNVPDARIAAPTIAGRQPCAYS